MAPRLPFLWGGAQGFCGGSVIITPYWWCSLCSLRTTTDEDRGSDDCTALHGWRYCTPPKQRVDEAACAAEAFRCYRALECGVLVSTWVVTP